MIHEIERTAPGTELLIIDDGSPDGTASIVKELQASKSFIHLHERKGKLGLGTAYIMGFGWALENKFDKVVTMDCDFSHDPENLAMMFSTLDDNELVVGSRYVNGIRIMNWPFSRLLLSYGASLYTRIITGIPFYDPTGGFNGYTARALQNLNLKKIFSVGYAFQIELKYKVWSKGFRCKEVPIVFWERTEGASKMGKNIIFEAVINVIRLRLKKSLGSL
ncbi:MAG: polyprenol monophosphomannose synthase [Bacteriovoracaceae bacterium]|nr:polyprenol monophosphomannose synthase [Bacteriovoracaceae bacterium]